MTTGADVVAEARTWIGTKWQHGQSCKGHGADCLGLYRGCARELGFVDPFAEGTATRFAGYSPIPQPELLIEACETYLVPVPLGRVRLGDAYVMAFVGDQPQHFAIISCLNPRRIIHAYAQSRKVVETGVDIFGAKILRAYRLPGIE